MSDRDFTSVYFEPNYRKPRFSGHRVAPYPSVSEFSSQSEISSISTGSNLSQRIARLKQQRQNPSRVLYSKNQKSINYDTDSNFGSESSYIPSSAADLQKRLSNLKRTKKFIQKHKREDLSQDDFDIQQVNPPIQL